MLDDNPVLKERLTAIGAFAGIGIGAIAAFDLLITGGFDFGPGRAPYDREQPSAYIHVVDAAQYVSDSFRSIGSDDGLFSTPDTSVSEERLAGADDGAPAPETVSVVSNEAIYQQIEALYSRQEERYVEEATYEDAPAYDEQRYEEPVYDDDYASDDDGKAKASAYENESPW